jgi:ketosteroid isomerase-like protein
MNDSTFFRRDTSMNLITATLLTAAVIAGAACASGRPASPQAAVDELLAADRSYAAASAMLDLPAGIGAMFAPDVILPVPGGFADGRQVAIESLQRDPLNATSRATWVPLRGGISMDATHGFTYGFMTVTRADGTALPLKYLAYWVRGDDGWRVAVYRRGRRPEGDVSTALMTPALPRALVRATTDSAAVEAHRASLAAAERAFSDDAQVMGAGAAFARWGSADAMNMGGPARPDFLIGNDAIGRQIGEDLPDIPAAIHWAPERVIVASSGDLGVSIGFIREHASAARAGEPAPSGIPFFTIWRREDTGSPWRYVAE